MSWKPNEQGLNQILQLLSMSQKGHTDVHQRVNKTLDDYNNSLPDFNNYLAYIFSQMKNQHANVRQLAGILLKNNLKSNYQKIHPEAMNHIQQLTIMALADDVSLIRNTAGSIITSLLSVCGLKGWPDLLNSLVHMLSSNQVYAVDGAMAAICKICEDNHKHLTGDSMNRPLNFLVPKLIQFFQHPDENVRKNAVSAIVAILPYWPNAVLVNMEAFMKGIFKLASDKSTKIKKEVCKTFVCLLEKPEYLKPYIKDIFEYMLQCTQDKDELLALEACEFWGVIPELDACSEFLGPLKQFLPRLIPVLLNSMVYSEIDRFVLDEESKLPDKESDIAPIFVKPRVHNVTDPSFKKTGTSNNQTDVDEEDDEEDDEYDDFADSEWNLRKSSAASLDYMASVYKNDVLPILLGIVQQKMQPQQPWYVRESAILALGAIAEGCETGMSQFLPNLIPYLIKSLDDPKPLVRSITCWTLSRYAHWITQEKPDPFFKPVLVGLTKMIMDRNKKVQEAACSAFITLEEKAESLLIPYIGPILQNLMSAFEFYSKKNLLILYDAISTLADSVGSELNKPEFIKILMPPLIQAWNKVDNGDRKLFPLLECLTSIAVALGPGFQQFAAPVYKRCLTLIENTYIAEKISKQTNDDPPEKDFIICSLDLISGIVEGLGPSVEGLIGNSNVLQLLYTCMKDNSSDVRQSAFALVGDLAKTCIGHLRNCLKDYIQILIENISDNVTYSVCNNAIWALGEISMQVGASMKPYVQPILQKLIPLINKEHVSNLSLLENTAVTIGRLGLVCTDVVAPHLASFSQSWALVLRRVKDDVEKEHAFRGLCALIRANPKGVLNTFPFICDAISSWTDPKPALKQEFSQILHGFKETMGSNWNEYFSRFPPQLRQNLQKGYNL